MMQAGQKFGMQTMNQALFNAIIQGYISEDEAKRRTHDEQELRQMLGEKTRSY